MVQPLSKNRVLGFIKRYPHLGSFLLTGNALYPTLPAGQTSAALPRCNVGLTGRDGNPREFSRIIDMWRDPNERQKLNPFALMRLWAAIYRTYYDWVKQVKRVYPRPGVDPGEIVATPVTAPLQPGDFEVRFIINETGKSLTFPKGLLQPTGDMTARMGSSKSLFNEHIYVQGVQGGTQTMSVRFAFPNEYLSGKGAGTTVGSPYNYMGTGYGNTVSMRLTFDKPVDIEAIRLPSPSWNYHDDNSGTGYAPETGIARVANYAMGWYAPQGFTIKSSSDGIVFDKSFRYNLGYRGITAATNYLFRQGLSDTNIDPNNANLGSYPTFIFSTPTSTGTTYQSDLNCLSSQSTSPAREPSKVSIERYKLIDDDLSYDWDNYQNYSKSPIPGQVHQPKLRPAYDYSFSYTVNPEIVAAIRAFNGYFVSEPGQSNSIGNYPDFLDYTATIVYSRVNPEYTIGTENFGTGDFIQGWKFDNTIQVYHEPSKSYRTCKLVTSSAGREVLYSGRVKINTSKVMFKDTGTRSFRGMAHSLLGAWRPEGTQYDYLDDIFFNLYVNDPTYSGLAPLLYKSHFATGIFHLYDITNGRLVVEGLFKPDIFPLEKVKTVEITSGIKDFTDPSKQFLFQIALPYVKGTTTKYVTTLPTINKGDFIDPANSLDPINWNDPYWSNNSPEDFMLGGQRFSDKVAARAFSLANKTTISNVDKWKLLPFTLPSSSDLLDDQLATTTFTLQNLPNGFEYEEDYIDNRLIPIPEIAELTNIEQAAGRQAQSPYGYYMREEFSDLLYELVSYCRQTCLKFWRYDFVHSVMNYKDYSSVALQYQNETLSFQSLVYDVDPISLSLKPNPNLGTYEFADADIDIEKSRGPAEMWFLSGGTPSRVDVDTSVLQQILGLAGVTVGGS